ncbi:hypothetical protein BKA70DRAFT_1440853 [Coprinopsis sp. MPI-PUGE-AT-0042]|nr:hypothetical protein BKA70DRAFT_1440853 [Coprinopsis sp. MPI-PUGE-AT-0042]
MNTTDIRSNGSAYSVASGQPPMTPECPGELHEDICRINEEEKRGGMKREEQLNREEAERLQREEVAEIPQLSREEKERKDRQRNERERAARDRRGREDEARRETERNAAEEEVKRGKLRRLEEQRSARLKPLDSTVNPLDARIKPLDGRTLKSLDGRMTPLGKYRLWTKILEDAKKDFERFKQEEEERRENVRKQRKHEERHRSTLRHQEIWLWRQRQDGTEGAYTLPNFTEKRFIWVGFEERKERSKQEKMEEKEKEAQELFEMFKRLREENLEQLRRRRDDALRSPIDLEQSRLEMRCAMVVKLHEVWLEMDLELEREVCKQRTSWMKQKGQEKDDDDQVCMKSITAMEDCLRQEHVKAVEKLRLNMQRSVEKEIERQAKTVSFTERDDPQTAENLHQPSKAAVQSEDHASLDQDLKDLFDTDERGDNLEGRAAEQTPLSSTSNELEGACTNLSERVLELLPPAATDQQVLATQTAEDILEQENQLSLEALPGSNDLTSDSKSKSKEGRICPSSPSQSSPSDDRVLPSDSRLPSGASAGLRLDPDSLGISGIPPPSSFHTSQYTQSTTDTGDAAQEAHSSKASAGPLRPGGKANFLDSENVQVNGGTFVAASTVITNNYYVTHFQSTPLPPPRSSNRGSMRPYSTYL